jgi:hypothetical protein
MNRSPLFYPLSRGTDAEAGGAADLQTDVMRFMAIISLCLVAIFALVQSIPLSPITEELVQQEPVEIKAVARPPATETPLEEDVEIEATPVDDVALTRPVPTRVVRPTQLRPTQPVVLQHPQPARPPAREVAAAPQTMTPEAPVATTQATDDGFTLRFETDAALTRLVARQVVGLYAISSEETLRMSIEGEKISFWPASSPQQFHEMDRSTVPADVLASYQVAHTMSDVKWGVTLPANMASELNGYLVNETGGSLVIAGNGRIALRN